MVCILSVARCLLVLVWFCFGGFFFLFFSVFCFLFYFFSFFFSWFFCVFVLCGFFCLFVCLFVCLFWGGCFFVVFFFFFFFWQHTFRMKKHCVPVPGEKWQTNLFEVTAA